MASAPGVHGVRKVPRGHEGEGLHGVHSRILRAVEAQCATWHASHNPLPSVEEVPSLQMVCGRRMSTRVNSTPPWGL